MKTETRAPAVQTAAATTAKVIRPGQTIGILGGGQLGRMIALSAKAMGYRIAVLDPAPDCPCAQVADKHIVAAYTDAQAADDLANQSDAVTYEFENVDAGISRRIADLTCLPQGPTLLHTTQHRIREKRALEDAGAPIVEYRPVSTLEDLAQGVHELGVPAVLKTSTGGYDGKGQWVIKDTAEVKAVWAEASQVAVAIQPAAIQSETGNYARLDASAPLVLEQFVPFEREISVVVARNTQGHTSVFPVAENIHVQHILHVSIVPARISLDTANRAQDIARKIAESLQVVGLLAVEMFLTADGRITVNELAPRPHNSGHYTQDACSTSQFEQHVRAVCGLPLNPVQLWTPVVMVNILGQHMQPVMDKLAAWPADWKLHLYGKAEAKVNRKMGHINILCDDVEDALMQISQAGIW